MKRRMLEVPDQKIKNIKYILKDILENNHVSARKLSSIMGKIIALKPLFGNICQLKTRRLSIDICGKKSWNAILNFDIYNYIRSFILFHAIRITPTIYQPPFWKANFCLSSIFFKYDSLLSRRLYFFG